MVLNEIEALLNIYQELGGDRNVFKKKDVANLLIQENRILNTNNADGVIMKSRQTSNGVIADILIEKNAKVKNPVHLCFGVLPQEGLQEIMMNVSVQDGAEVELIAHCLFPNAVKVIHKMNADIKIGDNAKFKYQETHYHGNSGGIKVIPRAKVSVGRNSLYENVFSLLVGRVGFLDFDYEVNCAEKSITDLALKTYGKEDDRIKVRELVNLNGASSKSLIKTRVVLKDKARAEIIGETYGNAPYARGHVDCMEVLTGKGAVAKAIPIVSVKDDRAKVTHEAAIGSIDKKQLETLMARGLTAEEAINLIVKGILK